MRLEFEPLMFSGVEMHGPRAQRADASFLAVFAHD